MPFYTNDIPKPYDLFGFLPEAGIWGRVRFANPEIGVYRGAHYGYRHGRSSPTTAPRTDPKQVRREDVPGFRRRGDRDRIGSADIRRHGPHGENRPVREGSAHPYRPIEPSGGRYGHGTRSRAVRTDQDAPDL